MKLIYIFAFFFALSYATKISEEIVIEEIGDEADKIIKVLEAAERSVTADEMFKLINVVPQIVKQSKKNQEKLDATTSQKTKRKLLRSIKRDLKLLTEIEHISVIFTLLLQENGGADAELAAKIIKSSDRFSKKVDLAKEDKNTPKYLASLKDFVKKATEAREEDAKILTIQVGDNRPSLDDTLNQAAGLKKVAIKHRDFLKTKNGRGFADALVKLLKRAKIAKKHQTQSNGDKMFIAYIRVCLWVSFLNQGSTAETSNDLLNSTSEFAREMEKLGKNDVFVAVLNKFKEKHHG